MTASIKTALQMIFLEEKESTNFRALTESELQILVENRIEFIKQKHPEISTAHDSHALHSNPSDIIDHFANTADPTVNKIHTDYITQLYKRGGFSQEDTPQIKNVLTDFEKTKKFLSPEQKNVNIKTYPHYSDIGNAIAPHLGKLTKKGAEKENVAKRKALLSDLDIPGKHELVHDDPVASIYHLKDKETSVRLYGGGSHTQSKDNPFATNWCTAGKDNNMFDHYKTKHSGEAGNDYFVVHRKSDGAVFQMHPASGQFMDKTDRPVDATEYETIKSSVLAAYHNGKLGKF